MKALKQFFEYLIQWEKFEATLEQIEAFGLTSKPEGKRFAGRIRKMAVAKGRLTAATKVASMLGKQLTENEKEVIKNYALSQGACHTEAIAKKMNKSLSVADIEKLIQLSIGKGNLQEANHLANMLNRELNENELNSIIEANLKGKDYADYEEALKTAQLLEFPEKEEKICEILTASKNNFRKEILAASLKAVLSLNPGTERHKWIENIATRLWSCGGTNTADIITAVCHLPNNNVFRQKTLEDICKICIREGWLEDLEEKLLPVLGREITSDEKFSVAKAALSHGWDNKTWRVVKALDDSDPNKVALLQLLFRDSLRHRPGQWNQPERAAIAAIREFIRLNADA